MMQYGSEVERTRHAVAVILSDEVGIIVSVYAVILGQLYHLFERIIDEDEADESRESLLGKTSEILHQETGICGNQHQTKQARPQTNPQPKLKVVKAIIPVESQSKWTTVYKYISKINQVHLTAIILNVYG